MTIRTFLIVATSCSIAALNVAHAQSPREATLEEAFAACSAIKDRSSRLECFDSLANAVDDNSRDDADAPEPAAAPRATIAPKPQPSVEPVPAPAPEPSVRPITPPVAPAPAEAPAKEKKFLIIPKEDPRAQAVRPSPFTATITKVTLRNNKLYIRLDNGETWKQTSRSRPRLPKVGMTVEFTRGIAGGWFAKFGNRRGKTSMTLVS